MQQDKQKTIPNQGSGETPEQGFELLDAADKGQNLTVRDDQYGYHWIADAAEKCLKKGFRFRLIDTGRFEKTDLIWLINSGLDLYTGEKARTDFKELEEISLECTKSGSLFAYLHQGQWDKTEDPDKSVFSGLQTLARSGAHVYISNKNADIELEHIKELAEGCQDGGNRLVYYHHGPIKPLFLDIGNQGAWIHISEASVDPEQRLLLIDTCQSSSQNGGGLVVHLESPVSYEMVEDLMNAGAYIIFLYSHFDYKSPFKELEKRARRKKCDFRTYYLQHDFLL